MLIFITLMSIFARADDSSYEGTPRLKLDPGQPVIMEFSDGRQADLKMVPLETDVLSVPFVISDNNCSNRQGMICIYKFKLRRLFFAMIWTKHPDPERLGKILKSKENSSSSSEDQNVQELKIDVLMSGLESKKNLYNSGLPKHQIVCDDFSWLPTQTKSAPSSLKINRWEGEFNFENLETAANENRPASGAYGVIFNRLDSKTVEVSDVLSWKGLSKENAILNLFSNLGLSATQNNGEMCEIGISNSGYDDVLRPEFHKLEEKILPYSQAPTFIYEPNGILDRKSVRSDLKEWLNMSGGKFQ